MKDKTTRQIEEIAKAMLEGYKPDKDNLPKQDIERLLRVKANIEDLLTTRKLSPTVTDKLHADLADVNQSIANYESE